MKFELECPNCGAQMTFINGQYECEHCNTTVLSIFDLNTIDNASDLPANELEKIFNDNTQKMVISLGNIDDIDDVNEIINKKKIKDATGLINKRLFTEAKEKLDSIDLENNFMVLRLKLLASVGATNETNLIYKACDLNQNEYYKNLMNISDEKTKEIYKEIATICLKNYDTEKEITGIKKLIDENLSDEAVIYAKKMCAKYPNRALSWKLYIEAMYMVDPNYDFNNSYNKLTLCNDYLDSEFMPDCFAETYKLMVEHNQRVSNIKCNFSISIILLIIQFILFGGQIVVALLPFRFFKLVILMVFLMAIGFISMVNLFKSIWAKLEYKGYDCSISLPDKIALKEEAIYNKNKMDKIIKKAKVISIFSKIFIALSILVFIGGTIFTFIM